jgi:hypothetical protein
LGARGLHPALGEAQTLLGPLIDRPGGEALLQEAFLPLEGRRGQPEARLGGAKPGAGGVEIRLLLPRVDTREHVVRRHVVAHIHQPLDDLAADPEREGGAGARCDLSSQDDGVRIGL